MVPLNVFKALSSLRGATITQEPWKYFDFNLLAAELFKKI